MKIAAISLLSLLTNCVAFAPSGHFAARSVDTSLYARKPFITGNWKLNPQTRAEAVTLAADIAAAIGPETPDTDVALFVPYVFIEAAMEAVAGKLNIGAEVRPLLRPSHRWTNIESYSFFRLFHFNRESVQRSTEPSQEPSLHPCSSPLVSTGPWLGTRNVAYSSMSQTNTSTDNVSN